MKPSHVSYNAMLGVAILLCIYNVWQVVTREYCIHDLEVSMWVLVFLVVVAIATQVCKRFGK